MAKRKITSLPEIGNVGQTGGIPKRSSRRSSRNPGSTGSLGSAREVRQAGSTGRFRAVQGGAEPQLSATRVGDLTREPKVRKGRHRGRLIAVIITLIALISAIVAGSIIVSNSDAFKIESMVVNGVKHLTAEEMTELAEIPEGATLINVDTNAVIRNLKRDAWIQDAQVTRVFPHTLQIDVTEREVTVVAEVPSSDASMTRMWAMSGDGMWLMPIPEKESEAGKLINQQIYADIENVLHIVDIPFGQQPEIGTYCTDENVNNAVTIVAALTTSLSEQVATVRATDPQSTTLILKNGVEIAFGAAVDIREKERVCLELLSRYEGQIAYINVRSVDNPTWRSL